MKKKSLIGGIVLVVLSVAFLFWAISDVVRGHHTGLFLLWFIASGVFLFTGIYLIATVSRENAKLADEAARADLPDITYVTKCPYCGLDLTYKPRDVLKSKYWKTGYIVCYRCNGQLGVDMSKDPRKG